MRRPSRMENPPSFPAIPDQPRAELSHRPHIGYDIDKLMPAVSRFENAAPNILLAERLSELLDPVEG